MVVVMGGWRERRVDILVILCRGARRREGACFNFRPVVCFLLIFQGASLR